MITKFSKRILSLFLAVVMFATTIPAFTMTTDAAIHSNNDNKYVFAYFTGDEEGQKIRLAISSDGHSFAPLNGNNHYLNSEASGAIYPSGNGRTSSVYPACGYARDPFIIEKVDGSGYWIVATDLKVEKDANGNDLANTYNNSKLLVWDVNDLASSSSIRPWNIEMCRMYRTDYTNNKSTIMWAPEVVYDYGRNMYMLFWSGPLYDSTAIQCCWTNDFRTFYNKSGAVIDGSNTEPEVLYSYSGQVATNGTNVAMQPIDADIVYNSNDSYYYMVIKNELDSNNSNTGELFILKSQTLDGFNGMAPTKININGTDKDGKKLVFEGPELYKRNDGRWVLITDQYSANPLWDYYMIVVDDLNDLFNTSVNFLDKRDQSTNINDCLPRHGAVATVSSEEYYALAKSSALPSDFPYNNTPAQNIYWGNTSKFNYVTEENSGMLYVGRNTADNANNKDDTRYNVYMRNPEVTLLWDGVHTPFVPVMGIAEGKSSGGTRRLLAITLSSDKKYQENGETKDTLFLDRNWGGSGNADDNKSYAEDWDWGWCEGIGSGSATPNTRFLSYQYGTATPILVCKHVGWVGNWSKSKGFSNYIKYRGNFDEGEYLREITPSLTFYVDGNNDTNAAADWSDGATKSITSNQKVRVINYAPIYSNAQAVKDKFNEIMNQDLSTYCPESLDAYLAAVAKISSDINVYFKMRNFYDEAAAHIQDIVENGKLELALEGPSKARIQYGNLFDFDAFYASGSTTYIRNGRKYYETNDGYHVAFHPVDKTVKLTGAADSFTSMQLKVDTYTIPVEPGQKYIFEFTSDSPYGDAMLFIPNQDHTGYNSNYVSWRPHGQGTQKVLVEIPTVAQVGYEVNYVFFRLGVTGGSKENPVSANINRIRLYKAEYENWASRDNDTIPADRLNNYCNGLLGQPDSEIGFTDYGQALAEPTHLTNKHFCGWYADEALTKPVDSSDDVSGCAILYAKYSDTELLPIIEPTCTVNGSEASHICTVCGKTEIVGKTILADGHKFEYASKLDGTDHYEFVCTKDHSHTNELTDSSAYEYADMIKSTLDKDRYANIDELNAGIAQFEAMKTNIVTTMNDEDAAIGTDIQSMIDESTRALLNAINDSQYSTYNLTFNVYENGVLVHTETQNRPYNAVVTVDASPYINGGVCQVWTAQTADTQGNLKAIAHEQPTNTYDVRLVAQTTVNAYYVSDDQANVVTLTDQYGDTLYKFIADSITINGNVITAGGIDYKVPDMPYMAVTGFAIDGKAVDGTVAINGAVKVRPLWNPAGGSYAVTLDGNQIGDNYKYDSKVTVTAADDAYAVAVKVADNDYRVAAYGNKYSFYVNRNMEFFTVSCVDGVYTVDGKTITDKLTLHKLNYKLPFVYGAAKNSDPVLNKYTAFSSFTVGSNAQIIEVGTLFYKGTGANVPGDMTLDNSAIGSSTSKVQIAPGNQFSSSAKGAIGSATGFTTRDYVKYSYTYAGATVVAVEYGNICSTDTLVD